MGDAMARTITTRRGRKLSEADVERLADWIESEEFDLAGWTARPGRPALTPRSNAHSPRIAVRVPEGLRSRVESRALAEGQSLSQVVRRLLEEYVRRPR